MEPIPAPPMPPPPPEPVIPVLPAGLKFHATAYTPDGGFSITGLMLVLLGLGAAGIVMGVATFYVSKLFYLIVLFPMLIGIALGALGGFLVKRGKVRAPWLAGAAGLVAGLLAMLTQHYLEYHEFIGDDKHQIRVQAREQMKANPLAALFLLGIPKEERENVKREIMVENFFDFMDYYAHVGVSIKHGPGGGANDKGMNLGYYGTYIYWLVEALIVACIVFAMTRKPALDPYCPLTSDWKVARCGDNFMVPSEVGLDQVAAAVKEGALGMLAQYKAAGTAAASTTEPVRLYVYASPQHFEQCTLDVKLVKFVPGKQGQVEEKEIAMATYPAEALASFEKFCN